MNSLLLQFFSPYLTLCHIASWGVAQNLEGLGLFGYLNNFYIDGAPYPVWNMSPTQGVVILSMINTIFLFFVFLLNVRACFYLDWRLGATSLVAWLLPGLLAVNGVAFDFTPLGPDKFQFGEGFPGGIGSTTISLIFFLILGWSVILLLGSWWSRERVKNTYDHIWYPLGLVAALYFVTDANLNSYAKDFEYENQKIDQYFAMYSDSVKNVSLACKESELLSTQATNLCQFSDELRWTIKADLDMDARIRAKIGVSDWVKVLAGAKDRDLTKAIDVANSWACDQGHLSQKCFGIPLDRMVKGDDFGKIYISPELLCGYN